MYSALITILARSMMSIIIIAMTYELFKDDLCNEPIKKQIEEMFEVR